MESNIVTEITRQLVEKITRQKEDLIKQKLIEKGFRELAEFKEVKRFPPITCVKSEGWEYYFADNGTKQGAFIVAIGECINSPDHDYLNNGMSINISFDWQDSDCDKVFLH